MRDALLLGIVEQDLAVALERRASYSITVASAVSAWNRMFQTTQLVVTK